MNKVLILENIRSVHNVGGIFRTADAMGVDHIFLVGYTPAPIDRFGRWRNDFAKAALGAEKTVSYTAVKTSKEAIEQLREKGITVVAVELTDDAVDYRSYDAPEKLALLFGNEVTGVEDETMAQCDAVVQIPMLGQKESLNVGVSVGVAGYHYFT